MVKQLLAIFPEARFSSGYVRVRCPYHKGGQEKKPSMSILLQQRGDMTPGTCHCFACGKVVQLDEMLAYLGVKQVVDTASISEPTSKGLSLTTTQRMYKPQLPHKFSGYLESRGIGAEVQKRFRVYEKDKMVHMPVFSRDGKYLFVNSRSTEGKYYYVEENAVKTLYGIEEIDMSKPIVVCEGQIDAMSFWEIGMQAVATLGAGNIVALEAIKHSTSLIILAFDNDDAGLKAREKAADILGRFRCRYVEFPPNVDINQLLVEIGSKEKLLEYVRDNTKQMRILRT